MFMYLLVFTCTTFASLSVPTSSTGTLLLQILQKSSIEHRILRMSKCGISICSELHGLKFPAKSPYDLGHRYRLVH